MLPRVHDDGVDREVRRDVPQLRRSSSATVEVPEDEVVVLVGEDTSDLPLRQFREELRVPVEDELVRFLVERHRRGGHRSRGRLLDVPAQLCEERIVLQEGDEVPVEVEIGFTVGEHDLSLSLLSSTLHYTHEKDQR